jgi:hypothetical protein
VSGFTTRSVFTGLLLWLATLSVAAAAPKAILWDRWQPAADTATLEVSHDAWQQFLDRYVSTDADGINRVAYARVSELDRAALTGYLEVLGKIDVAQLTRAQQFAYWVNLYNAVTVDVVLQHYPVASIRDIDISPGLFSDGPWGRKLINVGNTHLSLDDIEHRILRPLWRDPRIHYVVNCASISCPNLSQQAFTASNLERQLETAASSYINHPRGVAIVNNELVVSSVYHWYLSDFGGSEPRLIEHLRKYAQGALRQQLGAFQAVDDHDYNWQLNQAVAQ